VFFHGHDCNRKKSFSPQSAETLEKASEGEKKTTEVFLCELGGEEFLDVRDDNQIRQFLSRRGE
jgi:hypothetical protein